MPAARDVAGLIHSIDAAAAAALQRALKLAPDDHGRLALKLGEWRDRSVEACLNGYRETMNDARLWPDDPWTAQRSIDFFVLEKAFYQIEHEAAHRADRLRFPLAAILRMLAQQPTVDE
jgi:maltose alpha-D-glucosyltransferase/alpha-amylase